MGVDDFWTIAAVMVCVTVPALALYSRRRSARVEELKQVYISNLHDLPGRFLAGSKSTSDTTSKSETKKKQWLINLATVTNLLFFLFANVWHLRTRL